MIFQISSLLLEVFLVLIGGACLIRFYMGFFRINLGRAAGYQISGYLHSLTNWIIVPLRQVLPSFGRFDMASFLAAYLIALIKIAMLWFLSGAQTAVSQVFILGLFEIVNLLLSGVIGAVFFSIVLSWFAASSMAYYFLSALTEPLLQPIRNTLPKLGMLDLSPLALLIGVQILQVVLANLQSMVLR